MQTAAMVCLIVLAAGTAEAKRVKTPKSANAAALAQSHKDHRKHATPKVRPRKSRTAKQVRN